MDTGGIYMFKDINRDIKVSWVFTIITYLVVIGIILTDILQGEIGFSVAMLYYGFPLSLLAIFFSRTAVRIQINEVNHQAIQRSFYLALLITIISLVWLLVSLILS